MVELHDREWVCVASAGFHILENEVLFGVGLEDDRVIYNNIDDKIVKGNEFSLFH